MEAAFCRWGVFWEVRWLKKVLIIVLWAAISSLVLFFSIAMLSIPFNVFDKFYVILGILCWLYIFRDLEGKIDKVLYSLCVITAFPTMYVVGFCVFAYYSMIGLQ